MISMTDADLLAEWDELSVRLAWRYGAELGRKKLEALADDEEPDLQAWRNLGQPPNHPLTAQPD